MHVRARMPASRKPRGYVLPLYMSATQVVPPASISIAPHTVPAWMSSSVILASTGKIASSSQRWSGSPPPSPRTSVIGAWQWQFTSPGMTSVVQGSVCGRSLMSAIESPSTTMSPNPVLRPGSSIRQSRTSFLPSAFMASTGST